MYAMVVGIIDKNQLNWERTVECDVMWNAENLIGVFTMANLLSTLLAFCYLAVEVDAYLSMYVD